MFKKVIELVPIPDSECEIIEKPRAKRQIQQTLSKFLTANPKREKRQLFLRDFLGNSRHYPNCGFFLGPKNRPQLG